MKKVYLKKKVDTIKGRERERESERENWIEFLSIFNKKKKMKTEIGVEKKRVVDDDWGEQEFSFFIKKRWQTKHTRHEREREEEGGVELKRNLVKKRQLDCDKSLKEQNAMMMMMEGEEEKKTSESSLPVS